MVLVCLYGFFFFFGAWFFGDRFSLCSPGFLELSSVDQAGLKLQEILLPLPPGVHTTPKGIWDVVLGMHKAAFSSQQNTCMYTHTCTHTTHVHTPHTRVHTRTHTYHTRAHAHAHTYMHARVHELKSVSYVLKSGHFLFFYPIVELR